MPAGRPSRQMGPLFYSHVHRSFTVSTLQCSESAWQQSLAFDVVLVKQGTEPCEARVHVSS